MEFRIPVRYEMVGYVSVDAENEDHLFDLLSDDDFVSSLPLPDDETFINSSYHVDFEQLYTDNEK